MSTGGPGLERLRLRTALRRARDEVQLTQREVAQRLDWSPSKVVRIENGQVGITQTDLRALLSLYKVEDEDYVSSLIASARVARYQQWGAYQDLYDKSFLSYLEYEAAAKSVLSYQPIAVPGLLQTQEYARAVLSAYGDSGRDVERRLELRMARKGLLENDSGATGFFLLDEAVLCRRVGGPNAHATQIEHLLRAAQRPEIEIRVIPFTANAYPGWGNPFVILEFEDAYEDLLFLENPRGDQVTRDDQELLSNYKATFYSVFSQAVDLRLLESKFVKPAPDS